tara:strand:- start:11094 stop:11273 length:180 start_codon:yes stop_codon:yes gene_type:complete
MSTNKPRNYSQKIVDGAAQAPSRSMLRAVVMKKWLEGDKTGISPKLNIPEDTRKICENR